MPTYEQLRTNAQRIDDELLKAKVLRGIDALNAFDPNWADYIDPSELLLESCTQCILGQTFDAHELTTEQHARLVQKFMDYEDAPSIAIPGYQKGVIILNGDVEEDPASFGFDTGSLAYGAEGYADLTEAWLIALGADD